MPGFLYIDAESFPSAPANGVYTDNPDMAVWMYNRMSRDSDNPLAACGDRIITSRFGRSGDMRRRLSYSMDTAECQVDATWAGLEPPFVHHGMAGGSGLYTYCLFVVANRGSILVNGEAVPGTLYARQDWIPLVGRPLSSCLPGGRRFGPSRKTQTVYGGKLLGRTSSHLQPVVGESVDNEKAEICSSRCFADAREHVPGHADVVA